jgi:hypothetical protein
MVLLGVGGRRRPYILDGRLYAATPWRASILSVHDLDMAVKRVSKGSPRNPPETLTENGQNKLENEKFWQFTRSRTTAVFNLAAD